MNINKTFENILGWISAAVILLICSGVIYYFGYLKDARYTKQIRDLQVQLAHAQVPLERDTIRDSIPVTTVKTITIDKTDYKKQIADRELIKELGLKVSQITEENRMLLATVDSVKLQQKYPETDSILIYHDAWADIEVDIPRRKMKYQVMDSIVTDVARIYKHRFLWWQWGTKGYVVKIVNFNPRSKVVYNQNIKVGK